MGLNYKDELEQRSNQLKAQLGIYTALFAIGLVGFFLTGVFFNNSFLYFLCLIVAGIGGLGSSITYARYKKEINSKQGDIIQERIDKILPGAVCRNELGLEKEILMESGLENRRGNQYSTNCLISGSFEHVKFDCANVYYANVTSSGKSTHTHILFDGILMIFDFENKFEDKIKIIEKHSPVHELSYGLTQMETESIEFEEKFNSYATNESTFFKVVTPVVIELILEIEKEYPGLVSYCFKDGKCYVGISSKEASYDLKIKEGFGESLERIERNIILIKEIIQGFGLSGNTFTSFESRYKDIKEIVQERQKEREEMLKEINHWG